MQFKKRLFLLALLLFSQAYPWPITFPERTDIVDKLFSQDGNELTILLRRDNPHTTYCGWDGFCYSIAVWETKGEKRLLERDLGSHGYKNVHLCAYGRLWYTQNHYSGSVDTLSFYDVKTGKEHRTPIEVHRPSVEWSEGRCVLRYNRDDYEHVLDIRTKENEPICPCYNNRGHLSCITRDNRYLVRVDGGRQSMLHILDLETAQEEEVRYDGTFVSKFVNLTSFVNDEGQDIVVIPVRRNFLLYNIETKEFTESPQPFGWWSRSCEHVVYESDQYKRFVWIADCTGSDRCEIPYTYPEYHNFFPLLHVGQFPSPIIAFKRYSDSGDVSYLEIFNYRTKKSFAFGKFEVHARLEETCEFSSNGMWVAIADDSVSAAKLDIHYLPYLAPDVFASSAGME